ncbi:MAG: LysR family transcriptional regulator, partial [Deltaproteobacteria bacterium]|nr:LysR family transcriptional regulator [Deltaproteobacteria bacterium]
ARLEQRLGVRLFDRNARAVSLTDEGRRLYESVAPLVSAIEEAMDSTARATGRVRGRLRVNVDPWFSRMVLAPRIDGFMQRHPELELELQASDSIGNLVAEGMDVALRYGAPHGGAGLIARKILDTRIITCAAPSYLARRGRPSVPRDLERHTCILFRDPSTGRPFEWELHQKRKRVRIDARGPLYFNDATTAVGACLAGAGIAQLMAFGTEELFASGALVNLFPRWTDELFPLYAYHPSSRLPPAKVRAFIDFAVESTR